MCRLFFSLYGREVDAKIREFLAQSNECIKPVHDRCIKPNDGFGLAWFADKKWSLYKQPVQYSQDPNIDSVVRAIPSSMVLGHIRATTNQTKNIFDNTHPFYYENEVFLQNGSIADFAKHRKTILQAIAQPYKKLIQGKTDTELLFYLFLTLKDYGQHKKLPARLTNQYKSLRHSNPLNHLLHNSCAMLFDWCRQHGIEITANIIYANEQTVMITRYSSNAKAPTLYWNKCRKHGDNGLLITSEPLSKYDVTLIPENAILLIDHQKNTIVVNTI
jgi:glutamine amidotransferase